MTYSKTLKPKSINPKPFPLEIFPKVVSNYIEQCQQSLNLVPDFMGVGVLSTIATLLGNTFSIKIKEGWVERPILWLAIIGSSGIRKTPSLNAVIRPLQKADQKLYLKYCDDLKHWNALEDEKKISRPIPKQLIVTDTTIEALVPVLKNNPNGILYFKDELMGWINDLARYNKGSAEQQWLSLYSNQLIRLNRKNIDDLTRVEHPFVNVLGGIQPGILPSLFENDRGINGFTSRIFFSFPEPIKREVSLTNMDPEVTTAYEDFIYQFVKICNSEIRKEQIKSSELKFSVEAQDQFYKWNDAFINKQLNDSSISEVSKSALSKMEALMPRLALVVHFMDSISKQKSRTSEIDLNSVNKAIRLIDYFYSHFQKVLKAIESNDTIIHYREHLLLKTFVGKLLSGNSKEEAIQLLLSDGFTNAEIAKGLSTSKSNICYWRNKYKSSL